MDLNLEILNSLVDSLALVNTSGEIVFTNKSWKEFALLNAGDPKKTDSGINYLELCRRVSGEDIDEAKKAVLGIEAVMKHEKDVFEMEYSCHSPNQQRWFIMRVSRVEDDKMHTMISHINITRRKLVEIELKKANETLNTTMYKIVHDIQSPLRSIEGLIQLYNREQIEAAKASYLGMISKSVERLKHFIQETLMVSLSGAKKEPIEFNELIGSFLDSIKYHEALKEVRVRTNISQPLSFMGYRVEIISVISNLVSNSLKYYDPAKKEKFVDVSITVNEQEALIIIKDNGIGMNKEVLSKIFDLNFQHNRTIGSGAGIGLYIVSKSLDLMHGKIEVKSEPGEGSVFEVTIPNN